MAQDFIGRRALVTLRTPEGRVLEGIVAQVVTDTAPPKLILHNVVFQDSGHIFPTWPVAGNDIADIKLCDDSPQTAPATAPAIHNSSPHHTPNHTPHIGGPATQRHVSHSQPADPAIMSFQKPRRSSQILLTTNQHLGHHQASKSLSHPISQATQAGADSLGIQNGAGQGNRQARKAKSRVDEAARLKAPFTEVQLPGAELPGAGVALNNVGNKASNKQLKEKLQPQQITILRREPRSSPNLAGTQSRNSVDLTATNTPRAAAPQILKSSRRSTREDDNSTISSKERGSRYNGEGWRKSPMLKATNVAFEADSPKSRSKKKKKNQRKRLSRGEDLTGWATEDATDIQELGEFDFQGSLAKFDKKGVFEQLRREDSVPEEERLVGHNRLASKSRPGTFGGTKLHPTENVLDSKPRIYSRRGSARQPSLSDDSDDETALRTSSRISSRSRQKRLSIRNSLPNIAALQRSGTDPSAIKMDSSIHSIQSIRQGNTTSSTSNGQVHRMTPSESDDPTIGVGHSLSDGVHFHFEGGKAICPVITPGGMAALEDLAVSEHNLTIDTMNENAGRSLAEIVVNEVYNGKNPPPNIPTAIFLVGNHRAGARTLVAARHLRNRGFNAVCCVLGLDRPGHTLDPEVDKQLNMIRTPEAVVANWREVQKYLAVNEEQGHFADAWVDALLAPGHSYDTLVPEDQNAVREMVQWANKRPQALGPRVIFSVDVPCGINASTGETIVTENNSRIHMRSSFIVCMGAPRTGLLTALRNAWLSWTSDTPSTSAPPPVASSFHAAAGSSASPHLGYGSHASHSSSALGNARHHSLQTEALLGAAVYAVDIGINEVWRSYGLQLDLALGQGVDFGMKWFCALRLDEGGEEGEWDEEEE